jgi:hypothetical protein
MSLGALQVREGSEQLFIGDRPLQRGRDYEIDYALGTVRFLNPDQLFLGPTAVRAQFQENQVFDPARQNALGVAATYHVGQAARLHAVGLYQSDRSSFTRPVLGLEPQSGFIGGLRGELALSGDGVTRFLDRLPVLRASAPSALTVNGEIAMSRPNPNRFGTAYVDDFEQRATFSVSLLERAFRLGSAPQSGGGIDASLLGLNAPFDAPDAVPLVWQNRVQTATGILEFTARQIDSSIVLAGTGVSNEAVLWLSLKPDTVGGAPDPVSGLPRWQLAHTPGPRWRSIVQALGGGSGTGVDLSRVEFVEFWVLEDATAAARQAGGILVFDFGTVREDVTAMGPTELSVAGADTAFRGSRLLGVGRLDSERDSLTNVFNAVVDDRGIHADLLDSIINAQDGSLATGVPLCDLRGLPGLTVFPRGDLRAVCTRRNNRLDTEDLNGDNRLDVTVGASQEDVVRYVFPIGDPRYYVRDGVTHLDELGRPITWRLYRIPFRTDSLQIGAPNLRQVEALRITFVAPDQGPVEAELTLAVARLQLVGAPWLKRASTPITGLSGKLGEPHGEVVASVISTEDRGLGYTSPPGVTDQADRREAVFEFASTQINEKSLRVLATDLRAGERAEALRRFTNEAEKNFLAYRRLRAWAQGRGPGWTEGDLEFFLKVGQDENNFYLFRTPLVAGTWEPEIVVDMARWLELRARIERAWLNGAAPSGGALCGGDTTAYVVCEGPYVVHVRDPGVAPPNLAQVSEVAVGILRIAETVAVGTAELWVDDIRLSEVVDEPGYAGAVDVHLRAAEFLDVSLVHRTRDDHFRQLGESPSYVTDRSTSLDARVQLDRLLPEGLGLSVPFSVRRVSSGADPLYVTRGDLLAEELPGLRQTRATTTTMELSLRRSRRGEGALTRMFLDPVSVYARRETGSSAASLSSVTSTRRLAQVQYDNRPGARTIAGAPSFLARLVEGLPSWIRDSEFGRGVRTSRLRWNPAQIRVVSALVDDTRERFTFRVPVTLPQDTAVLALPSIVHTWRNEVGLELRPFRSFGLGATLGSTRDLQDYGDTTVVGRLLRRERTEVAGMDVGFERQRTLGAHLDVAPAVSSWLRPRARFGSDFWFSRDPNRRDLRVMAPDSSDAELPETVANRRRTEWGLTVDLARLTANLTGDSSGAAHVVRPLLPLDASLQRDLRSSFDRATFDPDLGYQLGLGSAADFRERAGQPATFAANGAIRMVSGGIRLPGAGQARLQYRDGDEMVWSLRRTEQSEVHVTHREWPSATVTWSAAVPRGLEAALSTFSLGFQYRTLESSTTQGLGTAGTVSTTSTTTLLAPSAAVTWVGGVTTAVRYSLSRGDLVTAGNRTETNREEWSASAGFAFAIPESLARLRDRVRATLAYHASRATTCLVRLGSDDCRAVSDSRRRQLDARLDTGLSDVVRGGLSFSYVVTDQRHTSDRISQLVFSIFADINLFAGDIR